MQKKRATGQTKYPLGEWHYVEEEGMPQKEGMYHVTIISKNGNLRTRTEPHMEADYFELETAKKQGLKPAFRKSINENIHIVAWCPFPEPAYLPKSRIKEITEDK